MQLSSRFASRSPMLRTDHPLSDDQIRAVAPSIFAEDKHESRSDPVSYTHLDVYKRQDMAWAGGIDLRSDDGLEIRHDFILSDICTCFPD